MTYRITRRSILAALTAAALMPRAAFAQENKGRVLVLGATGRIGRFIAETIREAGYTVRGVTRDAARAESRWPRMYEWVEADVRDPRTLTAPLEGVDYIVSSIRSSEWSGPYNPEFVDYVGIRNLVDAAKAAHIKHFVLVSTATSGPQVDQSQNPAKNYVRYFKTKGEEYVRESGLSWTIIAPGRVPEEPGGQTGMILHARKDYFISNIAAGDVALVALDALTNPAARGKAFALRNDPDVPLDAWRDQYAGLPDK